jgi:thioredoxin-related protein
VTVDFEIEEYVATYCHLFKRSKFTLDDLEAYAVPFADLLRAAYDHSERTITDREAFDVMVRSSRSLQGIHEQTERENAA